jgi:hypothetical protein
MQRQGLELLSDYINRYDINFLAILPKTPANIRLNVQN